MEAQAYPPPAWIPSLFGGLVFRSSDKADLAGLTHAHSCHSTSAVARPYPFTLLPSAAALKPSISISSAPVIITTFFANFVEPRKAEVQLRRTRQRRTS